MKKISHGQLRNDSGHILRELKSGETFCITNNHELVGYLLPASMTALERARVASRAQRPARDFSDFEPQPVHASTPIDELIAWNKGDR